MSKKYPFTFGRIVVDISHQLFGKPDPSAFVIADMWANEEEGDEDVWCDHYRGHVKVSFKDLHDTTKYRVVGMVDTSKDVREQCKKAESEFVV